MARRFPLSSSLGCRPNFGRCCSWSSTITRVVSRPSKPSCGHSRRRRRTVPCRRDRSPHAKPVPKKKGKSKHKWGGQPGHPKSERPLIPVEQCDRVVDLHPEACRCCGGELGDGSHTGGGRQPLRHQVWKLLEFKPVITEYRRHRGECPCCRAPTCAALAPVTRHKPGLGRVDIA